MGTDQAEGVNIMDFAGIWSDVDGGKIIDYIKEGRRDDFKLRRKFPKIN